MEETKATRTPRRRHRKLTSRQVVDIRDLAAEGMPYRVIAQRFGVTSGCIGQIVRRETWQDHVSAPSEVAR